MSIDKIAEIGYTDNDRLLSIENSILKNLESEENTMYNYEKNALYDHNRAVMQHIRGLCEKHNFLIADEFSVEDYAKITTEIRAACNMAKTCGHEIRLFQLVSFDVSPIVIVWVHDTTTGEVIKGAIRYVTESGEVVSRKRFDDYHPYFLKREFNLPKGWYK